MRIHVFSDLWLDCDNRLAEAHWRLHDRANAIESWFALCHLAPEVFERVIEAADFPGLGTTDRMARRFGEGFRARDDPRVVSRLGATRSPDSRPHSRRVAPTTTHREPSMPRCRCWPIRVWMDTQLNSAVRSRPATRVCWSDFSPSGRGPQRLCRYRGNKSDERDPRQQHYACARRCATDVRGHVRRIRTHPPSPRANGNAPNFDSARIRVDDILSAMFDRPLTGRRRSGVPAVGKPKPRKNANGGPKP